MCISAAENGSRNFEARVHGALWREGSARRRAKAWRVGIRSFTKLMIDHDVHMNCRLHRPAVRAAYNLPQSNLN